jgi:hypothetical protein
MSPAQVFEYPMNVVHDPHLTLSEKHAILASCAVEAAQVLRHVPGAGRTVRFDDVMDALRTLDRQARSGHKPLPHLSAGAGATQTGRIPPRVTGW